MINQFLVTLVLVILIGIMYNTLVHFTKKIYVSIKKNEKLHNNVLFETHSEWDEKLEKAIILDSFTKWYIWLFILAICVLELLGDPKAFNSKDSVVIAVSIGIIMIIIFTGILFFLHNSSHKGLDRISSYLFKISILLSFTAASLETYLKSTSSIWGLFVSILIPIIFSFVIMKSVIDSFKNYVFQVFNFILLILFFNIFYIGFTFGVFYGFNNDNYINSKEEYIFYELEEINMLNNSTWNLDEYILVIYNGLKPFYSLMSVNMNNNYLSFIPFFEFIFGNIYNLTVIAFFVSYSVSKLINRQEVDIKLKNKIFIK